MATSELTFTDPLGNGWLLEGFDVIGGGGAGALPLSYILPDPSDWIASDLVTEREVGKGNEENPYILQLNW